MYKEYSVLIDEKTQATLDKLRARHSLQVDAQVLDFGIVVFEIFSDQIAEGRPIGYIDSNGRFQEVTFEIPTHGSQLRLVKG